MMLILVAGCEKPVFIDTVEQTPYLGLPGNIDNLFSFDVARQRGREGFRKMLDSARSDPQAGALLETMNQRLGFDPIQQIDLAILATRGAVDPVNPLKNTVLIARGRFDHPEQTLEKLRQWLGEEILIAPPPFAAGTFPETGFKTFSSKAASQYDANRIYEMHFAFPKPTMMVFSSAKNLLDETLGVIAGQAEGIRANQEWMTMLGRPDIGAMYWGMGNFPRAEAKDLAAKTPALGDLGAVKQYYYNINGDPAFKADFGLVCESIKDATGLTASLKEGMAKTKPMLALFAAGAPKTIGLLDKLFIHTELETTKISLALTPDEQRDLRREWELLAQQTAAGQLPLPLPGMGLPPGLPAPLPPAGQPPAAPPPAAPAQ
jgi:hypothetical protein